jgi:acetyl-CoA acetyltransferase
MLVDNAKPLPALMVNQACTTSTTCIHLAAVNIEAGTYDCAYALMSDRCSNGPHTVWPNPLGPGGEVISENWMMDNFNSDPNAGLKMVQTAENVAKEAGITKEECDAVTLRRYEQYQDALANDRAFQKKYMFPVEVVVGRKKTMLIEVDEGITPTTAEGLAKLRPVEPGGVISFGAQTHPADGNCGIIIATTGQGKGSERGSEDRSPDSLLRFFQGQTGVHGRGSGAGSGNGPEGRRPQDIRHEGHQDPQSLYRQ